MTRQVLSTRPSLPAFPKVDSDHDEALTAAVKNGKKRGNELMEYSWQHDSKGAPYGCTSFADFTRKVTVKEGAYVAEEVKPVSQADAEKEKAVAKGMLKGLGESVAEEESPEALAAAKKKEDELEHAKHRAMDDTGVARNPHVRATLDGIRKCSNPTCVEREDTIAGMAKLIASFTASSTTLLIHKWVTRFAPRQYHDVLLPLSSYRPGEQFLACP